MATHLRIAPEELSLTALPTANIAVHLSARLDCTILRRCRRRSGPLSLDTYNLIGAIFS